MAGIGFVLSKTPWRDRRQFFRQGPALVAAGHDVVYVAGRPDESLAHPFRYVPLSDRERRIARLTGGLNLVPRIRSFRCDLIQLCSVELLPLGFALKLLGGSRVVYDCREDIASAVFERRKGLPTWLRRVLHGAIRTIEDLAARRFDGIVTADPAVAELHAAMPTERKHVFYNTGLLSQFPRDYPPIATRPFDLAVLGSVGSLRSGTPTVLDALELLASRGLRPRLLLIGRPKPEVATEIEERLERYDLSHQVTITGHLPHEEVAGRLAQAKIGIVPLLDFPKFRRNIACKAFEYMACGMPTIASDLPPQRIFLHEENSVFFECGDTKALADRIEELLGDPDRCQRLGDRAREDVEARWNAEREQRDYCAFYSKLLGMPLR